MTQSVVNYNYRYSAQDIIDVWEQYCEKNEAHFPRLDHDKKSKDSKNSKPNLPVPVPVPLYESKVKNQQEKKSFISFCCYDLLLSDASIIQETLKNLRYKISEDKIKIQCQHSIYLPFKQNKLFSLICLHFTDIHNEKFQCKIKVFHSYEQAPDFEHLRKLLQSINIEVAIDSIVEKRLNKRSINGAMVAELFCSLVSFFEMPAQIPIGAVEIREKHAGLFDDKSHRFLKQLQVLEATPETMQLFMDDLLTTISVERREKFASISAALNQHFKENHSLEVKSLLIQEKQFRVKFEEATQLLSESSAALESFILSKGLTAMEFFFDSPSNVFRNERKSVFTHLLISYGRQLEESELKNQPLKFKRLQEDLLESVNLIKDQYPGYTATSKEQLLYSKYHCFAKVKVLGQQDIQTLYSCLIQHTIMTYFPIKSGPNAQKTRKDIEEIHKNVRKMAKSLNLVRENKESQKIFLKRVLPIALKYLHEKFDIGYRVHVWIDNECSQISHLTNSKLVLEFVLIATETNNSASFSTLSPFERLYDTTDSCVQAIFNQLITSEGLSRILRELLQFNDEKMSLKMNIDNILKNDDELFQKLTDESIQARDKFLVTNLQRIYNTLELQGQERLIARLKSLSLQCLKSLVDSIVGKRNLALYEKKHKLEKEKMIREEEINELDEAIAQDDTKIALLNKDLSELNHQSEENQKILQDKIEEKNEKVWKFFLKSLAANLPCDDFINDMESDFKALDDKNSIPEAFQKIKDLQTFTHIKEINQEYVQIASQRNHPNALEELKTIWKTCLRPPKYTLKNNVLTVEANCIGIGKNYNEIISQAKNAQEIRIMAVKTILLDRSLDDPVFKGKNIAISTKKFIIPNKIVIDVRGKEVPISPEPTPEGNGLDGADGINGVAGKSGGNVLIMVENLEHKENLLIKTSGSKGQPGGKGGRGKDGKSGENGGQGKEISEKKNLFLWSRSYQKREGLEGQKAAAGGNGGSAGLGGEGGSTGQVKVIVQGVELKDIVIESKTGDAGLDGEAGEGGVGGIDGKHGVDEATCKYVFDNDQHEKGKLEVRKEYVWGSASWYIVKHLSEEQYERFQQGQAQNGLIGKNAAQEERSKVRAKTEAASKISEQEISTQMLQLKIQQAVLTQNKSNTAVSAEVLQEEQQKINELTEIQDAISERLSEKTNQMTEQINSKQQKVDSRSSKQNLQKQTEAAISDQSALIGQNLAERELINQEIHQNKIQQTQEQSQQFQNTIEYKSNTHKIIKIPTKFHWTKGEDLTQTLLPTQFLKEINPRSFQNLFLHLEEKKGTDLKRVEDFLELLRVLEQLLFQQDKKKYQDINKIFGTNYLRFGPQNFIPVYDDLVKLIKKEEEAWTKKQDNDVQKDFYQLLYSQELQKTYKEKYGSKPQQLFNEMIHLVNSPWSSPFKVLSILQNVMSLDQSGNPNTPLSILFHEILKSQNHSRSVFSRLFFSKKDSSLNVTQGNSFVSDAENKWREITETILSRSKETLDINELHKIRDAIYEIEEFDIEKCTLYSHYFVEAYNLEQYPLEQKMIAFNFTRDQRALYNVLVMLSKTLEQILQNKYLNHRILDGNAARILQIISNNIQVMDFNASNLESFVQAIKEFESVLNKTVCLKKILQVPFDELNLCLQRKSTQYYQAHKTLNRFLSNLPNDSDLNEDIVELLKTSLLHAENHSVPLDVQDKFLDTLAKIKGRDKLRIMINQFENDLYIRMLFSDSNQKKEKQSPKKIEKTHQDDRKTKDDSPKKLMDDLVKLNDDEKFKSTVLNQLLLQKDENVLTLFEKCLENFSTNYNRISPSDTGKIKIAIYFRAEIHSIIKLLSTENPLISHQIESLLAIAEMNVEIIFEIRAKAKNSAELVQNLVELEISDFLNHSKNDIAKIINKLPSQDSDHLKELLEKQFNQIETYELCQEIIKDFAELVFRLGCIEKVKIIYSSLQKFCPWKKLTLKECLTIYKDMYQTILKKEMDVSEERGQSLFLFFILNSDIYKDLLKDIKNGPRPSLEILTKDWLKESSKISESLDSLGFFLNNSENPTAESLNQTLFELNTILKEILGRNSESDNEVIQKITALCLMIIERFHDLYLHSLFDEIYIKWPDNQLNNVTCQKALSILDRIKQVRNLDSRLIQVQEYLKKILCEISNPDPNSFEPSKILDMVRSGAISLLCPSMKTTPEHLIKQTQNFSNSQTGQTGSEFIKLLDSTVAFILKNPDLKFGQNEDRTLMQIILFQAEIVEMLSFTDQEILNLFERIFQTKNLLSTNINESLNFSMKQYEEAINRTFSNYIKDRASKILENKIQELTQVGTLQQELMADLRKVISASTEITMPELLLGRMTCNLALMQETARQGKASFENFTKILGELKSVVHDKSCKLTNAYTSKMFGDELEEKIYLRALQFNSQALKLNLICSTNEEVKKQIQEFNSSPSSEQLFITLDQIVSFFSIAEKKTDPQIDKEVKDLTEIVRILMLQPILSSDSEDEKLLNLRNTCSDFAQKVNGKTKNREYEELIINLDIMVTQKASGSCEMIFVQQFQDAMIETKESIQDRGLTFANQILDCFENSNILINTGTLEQARFEARKDKQLSLIKALLNELDTKFYELQPEIIEKKFETFAEIIDGTPELETSIANFKKNPENLLEINNLLDIIQRCQTFNIDLVYQILESVSSAFDFKELDSKVEDGLEMINSELNEILKNLYIEKFDLTLEGQRFFFKEFDQIQEAINIMPRSLNQKSALKSILEELAKQIQLNNSFKTTSDFLIGEVLNNLVKKILKDSLQNHLALQQNELLQSIKIKIAKIKSDKVSNITEQKLLCLMIRLFIDLNSIESQFFEFISGKLNQEPDCMNQTLDGFFKRLETTKTASINRFIDMKKRNLKYLAQFLDINEQLMLTIFAKETPPQLFNDNLADLIRTKPPESWPQQVLLLTDYTIADMTLTLTDEALDFPRLKQKLIEYQKSPKSHLREKENFDKKYLPIIKGEEIKKESLDLLMEDEEDAELERMRMTLVQILSFRGLLNRFHIDMANHNFIYEFNCLILEIWQKMKDCSSKLKIADLLTLFSEIRYFEDIEQVINIIKGRRCENWRKGLNSARLKLILDGFIENKGLKGKSFQEIQEKLEKKAAQILRWPVLSEFMCEMIEQELKLSNPDFQLTLEEIETLLDTFIALRNKGDLSDEQLLGIKGKSIQEVRIILRELQLIGDLNYKEKNSSQIKIIASLVRLERRYSQEMIDRFVLLLKNIETLDFVDLASLLTKINNGRLILDDEVLKISKIKTISELEEKLKQHLDAKRSLEMNPSSLAQQMARDPYNIKILKFLEKAQTEEDTRVSELEKNLDIIFSKDATSVLLAQEAPISSWSQEKILIWKEKLDFRFATNNILEVFQVIVRVCQLCNIQPRLTQAASVLLFWEGYKQGRGRLAQVGTGEGKSLIIAMWAILQCLINKGMNKRVDIITSSSVLAKRDCEQSKKIYDKIGFTVGNNCDEASIDIETRKSRYQCDILYGDIASFQRDILLNSPFFNQDIHGSRTTCCLIVDEVDSMLIDKAEILLYLSQNIPELGMLKQLYAEIWIAVHGKTELEGTESDIDNIVNYIRFRIKNQEIKLPKYLKDFVDKRLVILVRSAYMAKSMDEDDSYIYSAKNKAGRVIVIDKDTGVEQASTQWSNGLHQFLQLKNLDKLRPESLRAVFKSNLSTFKDCQGKVYGLSGTLGSHAEREFLEKQYSLDFFNMPRFKPSKYFEEEPKIASDGESWLNSIREIIEQHCKKTAILFICENVHLVKQIEKSILSYHKQVYSHFSSFVELKVGSENVPLVPGDVLVATNIAGRGIDLTVSKGIEDGEGLHVVLTYVPMNMRIEEQAFGRTARKGLPGTGQFCVLAEEDSTIDILKQIRDKGECEHLQQLKLKNLRRTDMEETLFKKFTALYKRMTDDLKSRIDIALQLSALKDRWAFFLESITEQLDLIYLNGEEEILNLYYEFEGQVQKDIQGKSYALLQSPIEITKLGQLYASLGRHPEAIGCFDYVILGEPDFSEAALASKVLSLRKTQGKIDPLRKDLLKTLQQANELIETRTQDLGSCLQIVKTVDNIRRMSGKGGKTNYLEEQTNGYISCYQVHLRAIQTAIGSIVTPELIRVDYPGCKDDDDARCILEWIQKSTSLLKGIRFSKKTKITEKNILSVLINGHYRNVQFPQSLVQYEQEIIRVIRSKLGPKSLTDRTLNDPNKLFGFLYDKEKLWKDLIENGNIAEKGEVQVISYTDAAFDNMDLETFVDYRNFLQISLKTANNSEYKYSLFKENIGEDDFTKLTVIFKKNHLVQKTKKGLFSLKRNADSSLYIKESLLLLKPYLELMDSLRHNQEVLMLDMPAPDSLSIAAQEVVFFLTSQKVLKEVQVNFSLKKGQKDNLKFLEDQVKKLKLDTGLSLKEINTIISDSKISPDEHQEKLLQMMKDYAGLLKYGKNVNINDEEMFQYFTEEPLPQEYFELKEMGFSKVLVFQEVKEKKFSWSAFAVIMLGVLEIAAGVALTICTTGFGAAIGDILISEGISDFTYGVQAMISGEFSWEQYGVHKAMSLVVSILSCGVAAYLKSGASAAGSLFETAATQMGKSAARKAIVKAVCGQVGKTLIKQLALMGTNIAVEKLREALLDKLLENITNMIVKATTEQIEKEFLVLKSKVDELFKASHKHHQAKQNLEFINKTVMETLGSSFAETSNLVMTVMQHATDTLAVVADETSDAARRSPSLKILIEVLRLVPTILQASRFGREIELMKTYISNFASNFSQNIEDFKKDYEQKKNTNSTDTRESHEEFDKSAKNILAKSKEQLTEFLKDKINQEIKALASSVLSFGANDIVRRAVEKSSHYIGKTCFKESFNKWHHVVDSHTNKKYLAKKGDIEGIKQEDHRATHEYIKSWRTKQHLDNSESQDTVSDHLSKYKKSVLGYDQYENIIVKTKQTYEDVVHDIVHNESNAGALHQQIASDKMKKHIEVINEQGEILLRTSPLAEKADDEKPIRILLSQKDGELHFSPILHGTNEIISIEAADFKKACLYDSILFSDEISKGCSKDEALEKVYNEACMKNFQTDLVMHALANEAIRDLYNLGYHDFIESFHGAAISKRSQTGQGHQGLQKDKIVFKKLGGKIIDVEIKRPSRFCASTQRALAEQYPTFFKQNGTRIKKNYHRCHDVPWAAMREVVRACTIGKDEKTARATLLKNIKNLVSPELYKTFNRKTSLKEISLAYVHEVYNNPENLYPGDARENMSGGSKYVKQLTELFQTCRKSSTLRIAFEKARDPEVLKVMTKHEIDKHQKWAKNIIYVILENRRKPVLKVGGKLKKAQFNASC